MVYRKKKSDDVSKDDVPNEKEEFDELVTDILKIHDRLLKMGFEVAASDALKLHNNLLETKEKEAKPDKQIKKLEKLKDESIKRLKNEMGTKNVSDDTLKILIESTEKNFDEQINSLKKIKVL